MADSISLPSFDETEDISPKESKALPSFDETEHIELPKTVKATGTKYTAPESFLKGAEQGLTFGYADELKGLLGKGLEYLPGSSTRADDELRAQGFTLPDSPTYASMRDEARAEYKDANDQNPKSSFAGNIAGGALTIPFIPGGAAIEGASAMGKIGSAALTGAKLGAVGGLGTSEADLTKGDVAGAIEDTGKGATIGGVLGGTIQGVASGVGGLGSTILEKNPIIKNAYERGKEGIKTYSKEFADDVSQSGTKLINDINETIQNVRAKKNTDNEKLVDSLNSEIKDITKAVKEDLNLTEKLQSGINEGQRTKLELQKNELVKNVQDKFGKTKGEIGKTYDSIEQQIPDNVEFSVSDNIFNLQKDLETNGMLPDQAQAIANKFSEAGKIDNLSFPELKNLRNQVQPYLDSADPVIKKSFSNFYKNLNNTRAQTLLENPETTQLAQTLMKTDKRYAAVLDMEDAYLGKINFDKQNNKVYTDSLLKENIPNKEATQTINDLFSGKAQKLSDQEELVKKLDLIDPKLRESLQPQIDDLLAKGRAIENFKPNVQPIDEALAQNPEMQRLTALRDQAMVKPEIKTQSDKLLTQDSLPVKNYLSENLSALENPGTSSSKNNIEEVLNKYKELSGKDVTEQAKRIAADNELAANASAEFHGAINPRSTGFIKGIAQYPANMAGRTVKSINDVTSTIRNVTTGDVSNIISSLKKFNTPEAEIYAKQLIEKANSGPEARNATLMSLMQQPGYRAIMSVNKKRNK